MYNGASMSSKSINNNTMIFLKAMSPRYDFTLFTVLEIHVIHKYIP